MDTNQRTANNYQVNTFTKGMNSDTSYDMIGADQYLFGLNIRITNNTLLWGDLDSNNTEMVVAPVPAGKSFTSGVITLVDKILAVDSIENIGVVIVKNTTNKWEVYKATYSTNDVVFESIYISQNEPKVPKFSTVMIKEVEGVVKVYIADGINPVVQLFVQNDSIEDLQDYYNGVEERLLSSNSYFPFKKVRLKKTSGNLKTQQVLYTYRFYRKYGTTSRLAPLTNKIHIIGSNRNIEIGNAENTVTDIGMGLTVPISDIIIDGVRANKLFDRILIFRISYIKPRQTPKIYLIKDEKIDNVVSGYTVVDNGIGELLEYSLEEFSALQTQTLVPEIIESNQGYLFQGNVKDETIIELIPECGISIDPTTFDIKLDDGLYYDSEQGKDIKPTVSVHTKTDDNNNLIGRYFEQCGIDYSGDVWYGEMFTSSLLRSLRYDEKYSYGIVFYDKYGNRTRVKELPEFDSSRFNFPFYLDGYANPFGILITITNATEQFWKDFVGYEVVRREKSYNHTKNLVQVALSRPSRQGKYLLESYRTPYYPNSFLTSQFMYYISSSFGGKDDHDSDTNELWRKSDKDTYPRCYPYFDCNATNVENFSLYLAFAPEINIYRNDIISQLSSGKVSLNPFAYFYEGQTFVDSTRTMQSSESTPYVIEWYQRNEGDVMYYTSKLENESSVHKLVDGVYLFYKFNVALSSENKPEKDTIFKLRNRVPDISKLGDLAAPSIVAVSDVKNPSWENAFSNVLHSTDSTMRVSQAIKQYKSYSTSIYGERYNNWVSGGMYDMAATYDEAGTQPGNRNNDDPTLIGQGNWVFRLKNDTTYDSSDGWIGPGPVCLLIKTEDPSEDSLFRKQVKIENQGSFDFGLGTIIANITHDVLPYQKTDPYYGFGNYFELSNTSGEDVVYSVTNKVFDGDVYQNYSEFTNLFKTYDFNDQKYTLLSGLIVYYIPTESKINVEFDYGMNYRNTESSNLLLEPGQIEGIASLTRPLHLYNLVYSDNDWSINVYTQDLDDDVDITQYPQRIAYSQLKTNGEFIDNWQIFRPADFIDTDSRYGEVTELLSRDNNLYFWQTGAFGKLSVNERSLVTDDNGETIQLGQGGVLQRVDYLSTKYGIRKYDYCVTSTEDALYWIDILNKAILICRQNQVANYGEQLNVQNIINKYIYKDDSNTIPRIHYDLQTNELLCQCLKDEEGEKQLVFNTKYNIATSLYTRRYSDIILLNNTLVSLVKGGTNIFPNLLNYLNAVSGYLNPTILLFVVNSSSSQTKVFDNQKVVTLNRNNWEEEEYEDGEDDSHMKSKTFWDKHGPYLTAYISSKEYEFSTDIRNTNNKPNAVTDREGNIVYDIPRTGSNDWGDRLRGKWMKETITDTQPRLDYCISHIITKFRQSYS